MTNEEYLESFLVEVKQAELDGKRGVFKINEVISDNMAKKLEAYLKLNTKHIIKFERCSSCTKTWDIIIMFRR